MKQINQKHHTGFGILNLANGDVRITVATTPNEMRFGIPLILEKEFKKEVAIALCPELEKNNDLEVRRRERIRNLLNQCQLLFMESGSDSDKQVFEALKESLRENITLRELESLRAENMPIEFNWQLPIEQQNLSDISFQTHPMTWIVKINKEENLEGWWYDDFEETLTVKDYPAHDSIKAMHVFGRTPDELYMVDNGSYLNYAVLKKHCIII